MNKVLMTSITIEDLQTLMIDCFNSCLKHKNQFETKVKESDEQFFNVQQTANFLGLTSATIYSKVSRKELPFMKRNGRLYFSKQELLEYLKEGKVIHQGSVSDEVDELLSNNKKGLRYGK